jgi:hypothetical protein
VTTFDGRSQQSTEFQEPPTLVQLLDDQATNTRETGSRWFLSEYDFDNRGFNVLHFMGNSPLPYGFNVWGFIDVEGADRIGADREDLSRYFLEFDVTKTIWNDVGIVGEYNDGSGEGNEIGRLGVFFQLTLPVMSPEGGVLAGKGILGLKLFVIESDGHGWQASLNWNKKFDNVMDGRLSAGGFFDINFDTGPNHDKTRIVTEHQVRLRLLDGLHMITEFRLNEFLRNDFGIAPGLQYRF